MDQPAQPAKRRRTRAGRPGGGPRETWAGKKRKSKAIAMRRKLMSHREIELTIPILATKIEPIPEIALRLPPCRDPGDAAIRSGDSPLRDYGRAGSESRLSLASA